jgi:hypothetical protein
LPGAAVGGAIDFGVRVASGQDPAHAAGGALASTAGAVAGGVIGGALGGPAGVWIGSTIGGIAGGAIYDKLFPPSVDGQQNGQSPEREGPPPFFGGQSACTAYLIDIRFSGYGAPPGIQTYGANGRISSLGWQKTGEDSESFIISCYPCNLSGKETIPASISIIGRNPKDKDRIEASVVGVRRADGEPDTAGNPPGGPIPEDNRNPDSKTRGPYGIGKASPPGAYSPTGQPAGQRRPTPDLPPLPQPAPAPGAKPSGYQPSPYDGAVPGPNNRGQSTPTPTYWPNGNPGSGSPAGLPNGNPGGTPSPTNSPNPSPTPTSGIGSPSASPSPYSKLSGPPSPSPSPSPVPIPQPQKEPVPDSEKPPAPTKEDSAKDSSNDEVMKAINAINQQIAELSKFLIPIPARLNETAKKTDLVPAVEEAVCNPNGCLLPPIKQANESAKNAAEQAKKNGDGLDKLNAAMQGIDLSLLGVINSKLGPQIPNGGISGLLGKVNGLVGKTWDFLQIDRILNLLSFIGILHNAYFLSNSIADTLFSAMSSVLDATGLDELLGLRKADDSPVDVKGLVGKFTEDFFKKIFGVETVNGIRIGWEKASRIYQAASNILWSIQSIFDSTRSLLDIAINNTGKIGNALRRAGVVFENAYGNLVEKATARNRYHKMMDDITEGAMKIQDGVSSVEMVAINLVSIQDQVNQLGDQRKEVEDSIKSLTKSEDKKETNSKENSKAPQL